MSEPDGQPPTGATRMTPTLSTDVEPWTSTDLYILRPEPPGHGDAPTETAARGMMILGCECGEKSTPLHLSNSIAWKNRHTIAVLEHAAVHTWNCVSCIEADPTGGCTDAEHDCGHHCNHAWTDGRCCWCGKDGE